MQHATKTEERPLLTTVPATTGNPVPQEDQEQPAAITIGKQAIIKLNTARARLVEFQKNYTAKKLAKIVKGWEDKEGRERLRQILAEMRGCRVAVEKDRKAGVSEILERTNAFKATYLEVEEAIAAVEAGAKKLRDQFEQDEIDAAKRQEMERIQRTSRRTDALNAAGCYFDSRYYAVGGKYDVPEVSINIADLEVMSDTLFEDLLKRVGETAALLKEKEFTENARLAEEKERERREAQEKLEKEKQRKEQERLDLEAEKLRLAREKDDIAARNQKMKEDQDKLEREKKELADSVILLRSAILEALGMQKVQLESIFGKNRQALAVMPNDKWTEYVEHIKQQIAEQRFKSAVEKELRAIGMILGPGWIFSFNNIYIGLNEITPDNWPAKLQDLTKRIAARKDELAEVTRLKAIEDNKKLEAQKEQQRLESIAAEGDKAVWDEFTRYIAAIQVPEFKSRIFRDAAAMAREKLEEIQQLTSGE
jgi:hypothetical protein